ncbi:MAG: response regulator [Phycisphaerae bacterium]
MSIRVILVDDHQVVLDGLQGLLSDEPDIQVIASADNGRTAVDLAREHKPDVVVIDIAMPQLNGIAAVRQILSASPQTRVLALSMHTGGQIVTDMLQAGAVGYVVKSSPIEEVIHAIHTVMNGKTFLSPEIAGGIVQDLVRGSSGEKDPTRSTLSDREKEVLQLVAEGKSSKEIAATLHVTTKTIEWHRKSIMDKLGIRSIAELTKYAVREGLTTLDV